MSLLQQARGIAKVLCPDHGFSAAGLLRACAAWSSQQAFHTTSRTPVDNQNPVNKSRAGSSQSPLFDLPATLHQQESHVEELEEQGVQVRVRKWQWYDKKDEEEAQLRETSVMRPHAGYYHLQNVPQSMRKMNRVLAVVRGMYLDEALAQCRLFPHKAARYTEQILDEAWGDAARKGLKREDLVISLAYATKGEYLKQPGYKGKGHRTMLVSRRSHVVAELVPLPRHPNPVFTKQTRPARVRDTIMVKWANVQAKRDSLRLQQAEARQQQLQQL